MKNLKVPEGYVRSNPYYWYRPWVKAVSPLTVNTPSMDDKDKDPVIKMAGSQQPAPFVKAGHTSKDSLLGYKWQPSNDTISTDKGEGINLHPARRGLRPEWALLRTPEDLLKLHAQRPLRHHHALAAAHGTFDPLLACPWVAVLNKFCYRLLVLNTELQATERKNSKEGYDDI